MTDGAGNPATFRPVSPSGLADAVAERIVTLETGHPVRVAVDGPASTQPRRLADALVARLAVLARPAVVVESRLFYRDASVRLEFGRTDADAFYERWLDVGALDREVLTRSRRAQYLPALRDPQSNRVVRAAYQPLPADAVVVVAGELLLGQGLPFDLSVHLRTSPAARRRRTPEPELWTLPAFERYEREVAPDELADVVVAMNDPAHPAISQRAIRR